MTRLLAVLWTVVFLSWANAGLAVTEQGAFSQPAEGASRIVVQVNDGDLKKWNAVLGNIRNIRAELGDGKVAVTVVVIGAGLGMVAAESLAANGVLEARAEGVRFVACGNSMKAQSLTRDDLLDGVEVAAAGYVEIIRLQQQGWIYLRP